MKRPLLTVTMFVLALLSFQSLGAAPVPCDAEAEGLCWDYYELDMVFCDYDEAVNGECCGDWCRWNADETRDHCLNVAGCPADPPAPLPACFPPPYCAYMGR
jgi:hypothetical protein